MASYFNLTLDTTAPSGGSISFPASVVTTRNVTVNLSANDVAMMLIYGTGIGITEQDATWESYATSKAITLTTGDGVKSVSVKFRDDVGNVTAAYTATVTLDTTAVVVTISGPDVSKISKVGGYNVSTFTFSCDDTFVEYTVRVVPSASSDHTAGTEIPSTGGSTNMHGTGTFPGATPITCKIYGSDLETASAGDGAKIIKVFAKDSAGNWSV